MLPDPYAMFTNARACLSWDFPYGVPILEHCPLNNNNNNNNKAIPVTGIASVV
jgi:hypothetical protein